MGQRHDVAQRPGPKRLGGGQSKWAEIYKWVVNLTCAVTILTICSELEAESPLLGQERAKGAEVNDSSFQCGAFALPPLALGLQAGSQIKFCFL